jgi:mRNA interferase HigB
MKVNLVAKKTLRDYALKHPQCSTYIESLITVINKANWSTQADITAALNTTRTLGKSSNRVVFKIAGNDFRLICTYFIGKKQFTLYVNWIGTHTEYTQLCSKDLQYEISVY